MTIDTLGRDARYGLRLLRRSPTFTVVAIASLALGIGANAAIFHLIDAVRLRTLPVASPWEIGEVRAPGVHAFGISADFNAEVTYPLWEQIREHQSAFAGMFAWGNASFLIGRGADARRARGLWVSGEFFRVLGVRPERGRLLMADDDRRGCSADVVVISHGFWQTYFGGSESVVGSTLTLLNQPVTVIGVTPPGFTGLEVGQSFDIALPVCAAARAGAGDSLDRRDLWWLTVMGRLRPDWNIARADDHLRALSPGLLDATLPSGYGAALTEQYRALRFGVIPAGRGVSRLRDNYSTSLWLLFGLTGLVLLITCGNLATLMLARANLREREMAIRVAIGASRARLASQLLIETVLVGAAGAALAIPVAVICGKGLIAFFDTPASAVALNLGVNARLIGFVAASAMVTLCLFGLIPALRAAAVDPTAAIRQGSRGLTVDRRRARFQRALVVAQIAVSLVLVVSALLFVRSFQNLTAVHLGFTPDSTVAVLFTDPASATLPVEQRILFQSQLTQEIRSVPGVAAAASSTHIPLSGGSWAHFFHIPGVDKQRVSRFAYVSPGYFDTMKIPRRSGRDFRDSDTMRARRVLIVNEAFVRAHVSGDPLGATLRTVAEAGYPETTYEIVGVVGNTKYADLRDESCWCPRESGGMPPMAYVPIAQDPSPNAWEPVIVRSGATASAVTAAIADRVTKLKPAIAVQFVDLPSQIRGRLLAERLLAWLAGAFGMLALILVAVGLYGIVAYLTASRTHEFGIRLSLGSTRTQIVLLVLRDSLWPLAAGLVVGLPLAAATLHAARTFLFGLAPTDLPTMTAAACLLGVAAGLAACVPAWRAARVSPDVALRSE
jgi:putative ABC transport system permease protein